MIEIHNVTILEDVGCKLKERKVRKLSKQIKTLKKQLKKQCSKKGNLIKLLKLQRPRMSNSCILTCTNFIKHSYSLMSLTSQIFIKTIKA